jgi:hypothetical protein
MKKLCCEARIIALGLADPTSSFRQGFGAGIQAVGIATCPKSGFRPEARRNDGKVLMQESIERPFFRAESQGK